MIQARKVSGALGAEISGVDLSRPLDKAAAAEIRRLFLEHQVIFFRDQPLAPAQYMAFAQAFGEPVEYPMVPGLPDFPKIIEVKKLEHEKVNFGGIWHSDTAYLERPPMGSMLLAREIPPHGGDTLFASMTAAYEGLSEGMKRMLDGMRAVNASAKADVSRTREDRIKDSGAQKKDFVAEHPVVRTHPETGRKALYVSEGQTERFVGMSREESHGLLQFLFAHSVKPEFTYRHNWNVSDMLMWDNRCTMHLALADYSHVHSRHMHRLTVLGAPCGRLLEAQELQ